MIWGSSSQGSSLILWFGFGVGYYDMDSLQVQLQYQPDRSLGCSHIRQPENQPEALRPTDLLFHRDRSRALRHSCHFTQLHAHIQNRSFESLTSGRVQTVPSRFPPQALDGIFRIPPVYNNPIKTTSRPSYSYL